MTSSSFSSSDYACALCSIFKILSGGQGGNYVNYVFAYIPNKIKNYLFLNIYPGYFNHDLTCTRDLDRAKISATCKYSIYTCI